MKLSERTVIISECLRKSSVQRQDRGLLMKPHGVASQSQSFGEENTICSRRKVIVINSMRRTQRKAQPRFKFDLSSGIGCKPPSAYTHLIDVFSASSAKKEEKRFTFAVSRLSSTLVQ